VAPAGARSPLTATRLQQIFGIDVTQGGQTIAIATETMVTSKDHQGVDEGERPPHPDQRRLIERFRVCSSAMSTTRVRALIQRTWQETPRLKGVLMETAPEIVDMHARPGQFIVAHPNHATGGSKVYLVLASRPQRTPFELLLGEGADRSLALEPGMEIEIEPPSGKGYPMPLLKGRDVLLFAAGSGLASIRPVVTLIREARSDYGRITLFCGAHTASDFPYAGEFESWKRDRIDLVRAVSRPYVQDLFVREDVDVSNSAALVCGGKQMMDDVTAVLVHAGIAPEMIQRNF
jgi:NAD(P)H-flavin reductase